VVLRVLLLDDLEFGEARGCYSCVLIFMDRCKQYHMHTVRQYVHRLPFFCGRVGVAIVSLVLGFGCSSLLLGPLLLLFHFMFMCFISAFRQSFARTSIGGFEIGFCSISRPNRDIQSTNQIEIFVHWKNHNGRKRSEDLGTFEKE